MTSLRRAIVLFVPPPVDAQVDEIRRRYDPIMTGRIGAHITLVHDAADLGMARERVAAAAERRSFPVRLTHTDRWGRSSYGIYLHVDDHAGGDRRAARAGRRSRGAGVGPRHVPAPRHARPRPHRDGHRGRSGMVGAGRLRRRLGRRPRGDRHRRARRAALAHGRALRAACRTRRRADGDGWGLRPPTSPGRARRRPSRGRSRGPGRPWRPRSGDRRPRRGGGGRPPRCWRCPSPRSGGPWTAGRRRR